MNISVTRADINEGLVSNCHQCPIALAIHNTLKVELNDIVVTPAKISVLNVKYETPVRAARFIRKFDGGDKVQPFTFRLRRA